MATIICNNCNRERDVYPLCKDCYHACLLEIQELNLNISKLEREKEELEEKIQDLQIENRTLKERRE